MQLSAPKVQQEVQDALKYLRYDQRIYSERYRKGASALAALAQVLDEVRPFDGGESEFLELYQQCINLDEADFAEIWLDPAAFAWAVYTYNCVGLILDRGAERKAGETIDEADYAHIRSLLQSQLQFFKVFVIALNQKAGRDVRFRTPFKVQLPFTLPCTGYVLDGSDQAEIIGLKHGMPLLVDRGADRRPSLDADNPDDSAYALLKAPLVTHKRCHFYLNPYVGRIPGLQFAEVDLAHENPLWAGTEHVELVQNALDLVQRHAPHAFEELRQWVRCVATKVPRPIGSGGVGSATFTFLPGVIFLKLPPNSVWVAESLIHETCHQRLFFVDEDTPILKDIPGPEIYYSPWRFDKRPPHGLLHAVTVFIPVTQFFLRLCQSHELEGVDRDYAVSFVVRQSYQLQIGIDMLEKCAEFTSEGATIFAAIKHELGLLIEEISQANLPEDYPAMIIDRDFDSGKFNPTRSRIDGRPLSVLELLVEDIELSEVGDQAAQWKKVLQDRLDSLQSNSA